MPTIDVLYDSGEMEKRAPKDRVRAVLKHILKIVGAGECEVSCSFVTDGRIRELNNAYRSKDESTDILSFVQREGEVAFPCAFSGRDAGVLGDLVISLDSLERNCAEFGVSFEEELVRLLIHGVLHLLGEDHETNNADEPMLIRQEAILARLGKEERT